MATESWHALNGWIDRRPKLHRWRFIKWLRRRIATSLPDKCKSCALRTEYLTPDKEFDAYTERVALLDRFGLARYPPRNINIVVGSAQNYTEFCSIANVKYWRQNNKRCPDWQMRLPNLTLSDQLTIHQALSNERVTTRFNVLAIAVSVIAMLAAVYGVWIAIHGVNPQVQSIAQDKEAQSNTGSRSSRGVK